VVKIPPNMTMQVNISPAMTTFVRETVKRVKKLELEHEELKASFQKYAKDTGRVLKNLREEVAALKKASHTHNFVSDPEAR
jgi:hypothetical protein